MKVERSKKDFMEALHMGIKEKSKPTSRIGNEKQEGLRADELAFDPSFSSREEAMNQRVEDSVNYVYNPFESIDYILYSDTPSPVQDKEETPEVNYTIDIVEGVEEQNEIEEPQDNAVDVSDIIEEYGYEDGGEFDLDEDEDEEEEDEEDFLDEDEEEEEDEEDEDEEDEDDFLEDDNEENLEDEQDEYTMDDDEEEEDEEYPMDDEEDEDEEEDYPTDDEEEENEEDEYTSDGDNEDEDDFLFGDSEEEDEFGDSEEETGSYEDSLPVDEEFMSFLADSFDEKESSQENIEEINKEVVTGGYDDVLDASFNPFGEFTTQIDDTPAVINSVVENKAQEVVENEEDDLDFVFNLESVVEENTESVEKKTTLNEVKQKEEKEVTINTSTVSNTIKETESKNTEETEVVFDKGMGLVEFLRANPKIRLEKEILSYFKGEEIVSAIRAGKILRKKGKIIL